MVSSSRYPDLIKTKGCFCIVQESIAGDGYSSGDVFLRQPNGHLSSGFELICVSHCVIEAGLDQQLEVEDQVEMNMVLDLVVLNLPAPEVIECNLTEGKLME